MKNYKNAESTRNANISARAVNFGKIVGKDTIDYRLVLENNTFKSGFDDIDSFFEDADLSFNVSSKTGQATVGSNTDYCDTNRLSHAVEQAVAYLQDDLKLSLDQALETMLCYPRIVIRPFSYARKPQPENESVHFPHDILEIWAAVFLYCPKVDDKGAPVAGFDLVLLNDAVQISLHGSLLQDGEKTRRNADGVPECKGYDERRTRAALTGTFNPNWNSQNFDLLGTSITACNFLMVQLRQYTDKKDNVDYTPMLMALPDKAVEDALFEKTEGIWTSAVHRKDIESVRMSAKFCMDEDRLRNAKLTPGQMKVTGQTKAQLASLRRVKSVKRFSMMH